MPQDKYNSYTVQGVYRNPNGSNDILGSYNMGMYKNRTQKVIYQPEEKPVSEVVKQPIIPVKPKEELRTTPQYGYQPHPGWSNQQGDTSYFIDNPDGTRDFPTPQKWQNDTIGKPNQVKKYQKGGGLDTYVPNNPSETVNQPKITDPRFKAKSKNIPEFKGGPYWEYRNPELDSNLEKGLEYLPVIGNILSVNDAMDAYQNLYDNPNWENTKKAGLESLGLLPIGNWYVKGARGPGVNAAKYFIDAGVNATSSSYKKGGGTLPKKVTNSPYQDEGSKQTQAEWAQQQDEEAQPADDESAEPEYEKHGGATHGRGTSRNIKTSMNYLMARNPDLFGPSGKKLYDPTSKFQDGGGTLPKNDATPPTNEEQALLYNNSESYRKQKVRFLTPDQAKKEAPWIKFHPWESGVFAEDGKYITAYNKPITTPQYGYQPHPNWSNQQGNTTYWIDNPNGTRYFPTPEQWQNDTIGKASQVKKYQKGGGAVSELWEQKTGTPWSEAKKQGLTDGSYEANMKVRDMLLNNSLPKKQTPIATPAKDPRLSMPMNYSGYKSDISIAQSPYATQEQIKKSSKGKSQQELLKDIAQEQLNSERPQVQADTRNDYQKKEDEFKTQRIENKLNHPWLYNPAGTLASTLANFEYMSPEDVARTDANPEESLKWAAGTMGSALLNAATDKIFTGATKEIPIMVRDSQFSRGLTTGSGANKQTFSNSIDWKKAFDAERAASGDRLLMKKEINFLNQEIKDRGILEIDRRHPLDPRQIITNKGVVPQEYNFKDKIKEFVPNILKGREMSSFGPPRENAFNQYLGMPTENNLYRVHPESFTNGRDMVYTVPHNTLASDEFFNVTGNVTPNTHTFEQFNTPKTVLDLKRESLMNKSKEFNKKAYDKLVNIYGEEAIPQTRSEFVYDKHALNKDYLIDDMNAAGHLSNGEYYLNDVDNYTNTGGNVYWKNSLDPETGNQLWSMKDTWDIKPFKNKYLPQFIQNMDPRHIMGGKNFDMQLDYMVTPKGKVNPLIPKQLGGQNMDINIYQNGGSSKTVSQIWEERTGLPWSEAHAMGLTDGSYDKNLQVRNALLNGQFDDLGQGRHYAQPVSAKITPTENNSQNVTKSKVQSKPQPIPQTISTPKHIQVQPQVQQQFIPPYIPKVAPQVQPVIPTSIKAPAKVSVKNPIQMPPYAPSGYGVTDIQDPLSQVTTPVTAAPRFYEPKVYNPIVHTQPTPDFSGSYSVTDVQNGLSQNTTPVTAKPLPGKDKAIKKSEEKYTPGTYITNAQPKSTWDFTKPNTTHKVNPDFPIQTGKYIDVATNMAYFFGPNGEVKSWPVLTGMGGKDKGTGNTVQYNKDVTEIPFNERVTPLGFYRSEKESPVTPEIQQEYFGHFRDQTPIVGPNGEPTPNAVDIGDHFTANTNPTNYKKRLAAYSNSDPKARNLSFGCINNEDCNYMYQQRLQPYSDTTMVFDSEANPKILKELQKRLKEYKEPDYQPSPIINTNLKSSYAPSHFQRGGGWLEKYN